MHLNERTPSAGEHLRTDEGNDDEADDGVKEGILLSRWLCE